MNNLAIIPARGGSKRIPRKNIKNFLGLPIIAYSINAALESGLFDEVMVSTDDLEIAEVSKKYGAKVPFYRSVEMSNDFATTFDVINEVIGKYQEINIQIENICCVYPCAPFCNHNILRESYEIMNKQGFHSVFPIIPYSNPIQRALRVENDKVLMFHPEYLETRSQDLEKSYYDAGQFYWLKTSILLKDKKIYGDYSGGIVLDELNAHDIDNEIDWKMAELKYQLLKNKD